MREREKKKDQRNTFSLQTRAERSHISGCCCCSSTAQTHTHNRPRYNYSDPFVLHLWYYGKVSRHLYLHLHLSYQSNVFGYLIWYNNDNSNCDDGRIVKEKTKLLYCMSNKGCQQSWRCSRHEWRREHHPSIILTSTFNYIGTIHIMGNITMRHNCSHHSAINVNFLYGNWWIYCIWIWRSFLCDFAQIFSVALLFAGLSYSKRVLNTCKHKTIDTTILTAYTMYTYTIHLLINFNSFWVWGKLFVYQDSDSCYRLFTARCSLFFFSSTTISNAL